MGQTEIRTKEYQNVSEQRGFPVDDISRSNIISTFTESASIPFYYYNAGVATADAGQAAGTLVYAKLSYDNLFTNVGDVMGSLLDKSLVFTSTALTTEKELPFRETFFADKSTGTAKLQAITAGFANGEYCIDYRTGTVYGKKASTQTSLASVSYKIKVGAVSPTTTSAANTVRTTSTQVLPTQGIDAGGVVVGDNALPNVDYKSPADFTATYTSASTITLTGLNFTITTGAQIKYITIRNSSTNIRKNYVAGVNGLDLAHSSGVITAYINGVAASIFTSNDMYEVGINNQEKGYDPTLDVNKTTEQAPLNQQFIPSPIVETTNVASGTYYPSAEGKLLGGQKDLSFTTQLIDGVGETTTLELEITNDTDATAASRRWVPALLYISGAVAGGGVAAGTNYSAISATNQTTQCHVEVEGINCVYYRYKITTTAATNTVAIDERTRY